MESKEKDNLVFVRLFPNEDFYDSLKKVCEKHEIETAVILSGLGQLKEFELGYFKEKGNYLPEKFSEAHELISLVGNMSKSGEDWNFHIHVSLGSSEKNVIGGHLISGKAEITNEIILLKTDMKIRREIEEETGLKGLFLE